MKHPVLLRFISGLLLATALSARAQFTSQWSSMYLPGNFNGYDTDTSAMRLISNGVWQAYARMTNYNNPLFLFSNHPFNNPPASNANVWKETDQSSFLLPLSGVAELNAGNDIQILGKTSAVLRFTFDENSRAYRVRTVTSGTAPTNVWVNEFHYDNSGTDLFEGFEIAGPAGMALTNYSLVLYNGSDGQTYATNVLSGALTNGAVHGVAVKWFPIAAIQNEVEGFALVKRDTTGVVQFLSYGGVFLATNGPAAGTFPVNVGVAESTSTPLNNSLQLAGSGSQYADFFWTGPTLRTTDLVNSNQLMLGGPAAAFLVVTNANAVPPVALTNQTIGFTLTLGGLNGASNLSPTVFYRIGLTGAFLPMRMTNFGATFTSVSNVPPQPAGTAVYFYYHINFDGPGTNSPTLYPAGAPGSTLVADFSTTPFGSAWINEIDVAQDFLSGDFNGQEFVELAGVAGMNVSGWRLEMLDSGTNTYAVYSIPAGSVLPLQTTSGFGFYMIGDSNVPNVDLVFTNFDSPVDGHLTDAGGLRLYDAKGALLQSVSYGTTMMGFTYVGTDGNVEDLFAFTEYSLGQGGTGSNMLNFTWGTNTPPSPGTANTNTDQLLVGGNTNPILPFLQCPDDVFLPCPASAVPTNNPLLTLATGYCGNGSVIVTWAGDATNAGTGCKGSPKIITRTYRVVSTNCTPPTTNTCSQLFILEDTNGPAISVPTQTLANASFEFGSFFGWQLFGPVTNGSVNAISPRSGTFHGILSAPYDAVCRDSSGNDFDAGYTNGVLRGQPAATTNLGFSATFDGTDDYVAAPIPLNLNGNQATIACWIKRNGSQVTSAGLVFERSATTLSGLDFTTGNQLGYHWNGAADTYNWQSGIVPPDGQWAFVALTVTNNRAQLYMKVAGSNWVSAVNITNHAVDAFDGELRLGHDNTGGRYFKGSMDDVQIYGRTLSSNEIVDIWNNGFGGGTTNFLFARYKLDESFPGGSQMGLYQDLVAAPGQTWNGAIWARPDPAANLRGTNRVDLSVQFLNATNGVLSNAVSSVAITSASTGTNYLRLLARGNAPANTAKARLRVAYQQDGAGSGGTVYLDDAFLANTLIPAGANINQCGVLPNFLTSAAVSVSGDSCSGTNVTKTQSPPAGSNLTNAVMVITINATDGCGNTSQASFNAYVDDTTAPLGFVVNPASTNLTCPSAEFTNSYTVLENCGFGWFVTLLSSATNNGTGCPGSTRIITNVYQVTDIGGNTKTANQIINFTDTVAPVLSNSIPALVNAGFESGSFTTNWQTFGATTQVVTTAPFNGTYHARLSGSGGGTNYTGFYQDLPAQAGQTWRLGAWVMTPTNESLGAANRLEAKMEFFDDTFSLLDTGFAPLFTNGAARPGLYRQVDVTALAPAGAALVRGTFVYVQVTNAPGAVFLDDISLSRTVYSASNSCGAALGDLDGLAVASDCGGVVVTQSPPVGASIALGTNTVLLYAADNCGNLRTGSVTVVVADDEPPLVTGPTNIIVATTNAVPAPSPSFLTNADCSAIAVVTNLPDTNNGGAGTTNNPLVITRTYLITDAWRNTAEFQHLITVNGAGATPPPPTNVAVTALGPSAAGTNFTVRSTGTNTWTVLPEYATNLLGLQSWFAASNVNTIWSNGTNVTTFNVPTNARPAFIRVKQTYP